MFIIFPNHLSINQVTGSTKEQLPAN
uniref:Uncharacterized protein n=1 Tax=Anguilla anguilla TaxID=7936 RepID=A0A0E9QBA0_ANGAN